MPTEHIKVSELQVNISKRMQLNWKKKKKKINAITI